MEVKHSFPPIVIILLYVCYICFARFAETPSSVFIEVEEGSEREAMFRCRHEESDADIMWRINGTSFRQYRGVLISSLLDINSSLVDALKIPAIPEYNGLQVVCTATLADGSREETLPVTLKISVTASTTLMPTTTPPIPSSPPLTTPLPPTTLSPSTARPPVNFTMIPTSQNKTVEQRVAVFHCQHKGCDAITWNVNNGGTNNVTNTPLDGGGFNSSLTIETRLDLSGSTLQCVCVFYQSKLPIHSAPATLLVQGIPEEVNITVHERNYSSNAITTRWTPSPSLDLTDIDPDIMYDFELFMITCGENVSMSNQNVPGSSVTSEGLDLMQIYVIILASRNNVPDAENGPSVKFEESFWSLNKSTLFTLARNSQVIMTVSDPIPSYFTLVLNSIDGCGYYLVTNITVTRNGEMVKMQMEQPVPTKLLLNASVMAYGCEIHTVKINELSTHGIQNVHASSPLPGQIKVTGHFVDGSTTAGVVIIVYSLINDSDVLEDVRYIGDEKSESSISIRVTGLSSAEYSLSVFALEDGIPFPRVVTLPKNVTVAANGDREGKRQMPIRYKLTNTSTGVCVNCTFLDNSTSGCVVVVHQRISQLNSSGLMNIKASHKFSRSGGATYGCVEGVDLKVYQVGVIGGQLTSPTMMPNDKKTLKPEAVIVGTTLGLLFFLISVQAVLMIMVHTLVRKRFKHRAWEAGLIGGFREHSDSRAVRMRRGSADSNEYVVVPRKEDISGRSEEENSLLAPPQSSRLDTTLTEDLLLDAQPMSESLDRERHPLLVPSQEANPSSPDHITPDNDTSDPTYAQPILPKSSKPVCPPVTERVVYDDIDKFQNKEGLLYAMTKFESSSKGMPVDDLHRVEYCKIQPHSKSESESQNVGSGPGGSQLVDNSTTAPTHTEPPPQPEPFTLELLFSYLLPMASVWKSLGEALSLDEDLVDEINTNNETNEACLRVMLEYYMMRSDLKHNWEEIKAAERKVKEGSIPQGQTDNTKTDEAKPNSDQLKPPTAYRMSQESSDSGYRSRITSDSSELASSSLSALEEPSTNESPHLQNDPNVYTTESQQSKVTGGVLETIDEIRQKTEPVAGKDYSKQRSGIQECDSSSTSSVIDGSNHFSCSKRATLDHRKTSHIPDANISREFSDLHDGGENGIGTKWIGDATTNNHEDSRCHKGNSSLNLIPGSKLLTEAVSSEDSGVADEDFNSDPDLPNAPGIETTHFHSSHGQCIRQTTKDCTEDHIVQDDRIISDFNDELSPHIPGLPKARYTHHGCPLFSFVTNKDHDEEPCTNQVAPRVQDFCQESQEEMTEYSVVLMGQLGIGELRLSKAYLEDDSSKTDRLLMIKAKSQQALSAQRKSPGKQIVWG